MSVNMSNGACFSAALDSDEEACQQRAKRSASDPATPPRKKRQLTSQDSLGVSRIPPRPKRQHTPAFTVLEAPKATSAVLIDADNDNAEGAKDVAAKARRSAQDGSNMGLEADDQAHKGQYKRLSQRNSNAGEEGEVALERLLCGFAEDYFSAPSSGKLIGAAVRKVAERPSDAKVSVPDTPETIDFSRWLNHMQSGFSLLVQGVGSKRKLLQTFSDTVLKKWGAAIVRMDGFNANFSTIECLRDVLSQLYPAALLTRSMSVDTLVDAFCSARAAVSVPLRPLCLVVHNLEGLTAASQSALASLKARVPNVHIVASVDNLFASLAWSSRALADFNFCHLQAHTHEDYWVEAQARFPSGMPGWLDPNADKSKGKKASLSLVLRSLTNNHRELVQAIAERQLELGGRVGISLSALLQIATDRMIAVHATKLRSLLNELKDHVVVVERQANDGSMLYQLPCGDNTMRRLAEGATVDGSDDEDCDDRDSDDE